MLEGAAAALGTHLRRGLVIVPDGVDVTTDDSAVEILRSSHPVPDRRSVSAGARALEFARNARGGVLLALISGGASALVCAPAKGVTLADKVAVLRELTSAGATISELNVVRRHMSLVKGGGLARACAPARVVTLVASDVIGGAAWDIGSGPTLVDPTSCADARAALRRHGVLVPKLHETLGAVEAGRRVGRARVVATPSTLADGVARALARAGFHANVLPPTTRALDWFVDQYATVARRLPRGGAIVRAAEPTVVFDLSSAGRGGRSGHLAAAVAASLPSDVAFLAAASDGVDGSSGAAGAVVDARFVPTLGELRVARALAHFSTAALHRRANTQLRTGPTGHNLCDVHILARAR
jgi:hydroxypyruvate reductase